MLFPGSLYMFDPVGFLGYHWGRHQNPGVPRVWMWSTPEGYGGGEVGDGLVCEDGE